MSLTSPFYATSSNDYSTVVQWRHLLFVRWNKAEDLPRNLLGGWNLATEIHLWSKIPSPLACTLCYSACANYNNLMDLHFLGPEFSGAPRLRDIIDWLCNADHKVKAETVDTICQPEGMITKPRVYGVFRPYYGWHVDGPRQSLPLPWTPGNIAPVTIDVT